MLAPADKPDTGPDISSHEIAEAVEFSPPKERPRPPLDPDLVLQVEHFWNRSGQTGLHIRARDSWQFDGLSVYTDEAKEIILRLAKEGGLKFLFRRKTGPKKGEA